MFPLHVIRSKAAEADLGFVLIGGHAVNVYAEPRATLDVDLLVRKEDRQPWLDLLAKEGFKLRRDGGNFLQLDPPYGVNWRLDLMLVNASTFAKILAGGKRAHPYTAPGARTSVRFSVGACLDEITILG